MPLSPLPLPQRNSSGTWSTRPRSFPKVNDVAVATRQTCNTRTLVSLDAQHWRVSRKTPQTDSHVPANTIARIDNLEFLSDAVPKTISYQDYKAKKEAAKTAKNTLTEPAPEAAQASVQPTFEHTSHMHGQHRSNGSINDVEMRDVGAPGPVHVPILPNGHLPGAATNGFHATPVPGERPPTSDGSNGRAVFDVVRNGFQMSPEAALHPREE